MVKQQRGLRAQNDREGQRPAALGLAAILCWAAASPAWADLESPFIGKVTVDTGFVTDAANATDIAFSGDGRAVVTLRAGQILVRRADGSKNTVANPFGGTVDSSSEKGLLGVVADPGVADNSTFYFYVSNGPTSDKHRVYRAQLTKEDTFTVAADSLIVGAARGSGPGLEGPANHDGGGMVIHNGQLYIGVGDTGSNASPPLNKYGSCLNKGNGKILRVNLDGTVPTDNPLVGVGTVTGCDTQRGAWTSAAPDTRIFAWGLRNPFRIWVDPVKGLLWVGDVGEVTQEEISVGGGDQHYGYPFEEGNQVWGSLDNQNCSSMTPSRPCTKPVYGYPRDQGRAVTGGLIPDGCGWSRVFGGTHYVFGDSSAGWIRALPVNADRTGVASTTPVQFASYGGVPVSFRMGPDGSLYVVFNALGAVYRFTPVSRTGPDCSAAVVPSIPPGALWLLLAALATIGVWSQITRRRSERAAR